jgi:hypothetical protein
MLQAFKSSCRNIYATAVRRQKTKDEGLPLFLHLSSLRITGNLYCRLAAAEQIADIDTRTAVLATAPWQVLSDRLGKVHCRHGLEPDAPRPAQRRQEKALAAE